MAKVWLFLLACKEMGTRMNKLYIWMVPLHFEFHRLVSNTILVGI